ncbi:MAG: MoaD/ThiS family protein [Verrucomicrobiota bacterium]
MKVRVHFYAQLRDLTGVYERDVDVAEGSTVRELLESIYTQTPSLRLHDKSILIGSGVEFVDRSHHLKAGDDIAIMPPVQGG